MEGDVSPPQYNPTIWGRLSSHCDASLDALTCFIIATAEYTVGTGHVPSSLTAEAEPSMEPGLGDVLLKTY